MVTYNGHPSWEHWNVSLWFNNDQGLYNLMRESRNGSNLWDILNDLNFLKTPDGADITRELCNYLYEEEDFNNED